MTNWLFEDLETGENFFVQTEDLEEAKETAQTYFTSPKYICRMSDYEAEWYGYDTY